MYYTKFLEIIKQKYKNIDIEKYKPLIEKEKEYYVIQKNDNVLLDIWFCLTVIEAINIFHNAFEFLKKREYKNGWDELAQVEISINNIKYNYKECFHYIAFTFLDQAVVKFQKIFPYKLFTSIVFVDTKEECSLCGKPMDPFSGCEHMRGKVYLGELCQGIVTDGIFVGVDIVKRPAMKSSVLFKDLDNPEEYKLLEYLIPKLPNEYTNWDFRISTKYEQHSNFRTGRNEKCPCQSGKKYKNCCLKNPEGVFYENYDFLLPDKLLVKKK